MPAKINPLIQKSNFYVEQVPEYKPKRTPSFFILNFLFVSVALLGWWLNHLFILAKGRPPVRADLLNKFTRIKAIDQMMLALPFVAQIIFGMYHMLMIAL